MTTQTITLKGSVKYSISKDRDPGFETERNDCFVQAVKHAVGVPYRDAHAFVAAQFARTRCAGTKLVGPRMGKIAQNAGTIYGYRVFVKPVTGYVRLVKSRRMFSGYTERTLWPTLTEMIRRLSVGRFIVCSGTHAWAIVDGIVYDNGVTGSRTRVTEVYELIASSACDQMVVRR